MLRVAEHYSASDTGRQRRANEDSLLSRSPLFVVADGMGGAQAGEVASRLAIESFSSGLSGDPPEQALAERAREANARIHELSHASAEHAGMGTTLTALYVGEQEVAIAHVGDSRAYCLRAGELMRLTDDHSLVDELMRQGRLTPEEAIEHPQRSVITRALGPEGAVEVDTRSLKGLAGDVYLICSDGLTTMLSEQQIAEILLSHVRLADAGEALIAAANDAGGRDNITVLLARLEEVGGSGVFEQEQQTMTSLPAVTPEDLPPPAETGHATTATMAAAPAASATAAAASASGTPPRAPRLPQEAPPARGRSPRAMRRVRRLVGAGAVLVVLVLIGAGAYLALQSVYFIGTNSRGLVTLYQGVPFQLPAGLDLYSSQYVSGVSAATVPTARRHTLLDHSLRSESSAADLVRDLELGQLE
jgi:serine/threonine protein phosphatase PrpC